MTTLFIPSVKKSNGTGHLKRTLHWAESLAREDSDFQFYLDLDREEARKIEALFPSLGKFPLFFPWSRSASAPDRIVMDNRETSAEEWRKWDALAPVISLDEGGGARRYSSFLIDTLPSLSAYPPNLRADPLYRPVDRGDSPKRKGSVLITFGGEDPAGLTAPAAEALAAHLGGAGKLGIVLGPMMREERYPEGAAIYRNQESLDPLYGEYETVITSFGLTPFEARRAGCRVLLANPTAYHEKLSRRAGFPSAGVGTGAAGRLARALSGLGAEAAAGGGMELPSLPDILSRIGTAPGAGCPLCGKEGNRAAERFGDRTFYRCRDCGNFYLVNWNREEEAYDRDYFFGRYKAQYGKTYLEDFDAIRERSVGRLEEIDRCLTRAGDDRPLLTDLGCAFGPFLAAARDRGYDCRGVEINEDGARWIEENLSLPVIRGSLEDDRVLSLLRAEPGDVTTLWYVIEHMQKQKELLEKLGITLTEGGVLAFGTPSGRGISSRRDLKAFLRNSPGDHYVIYTPRGARKILGRFGFTVKRVKSVGHHPERFGRWVGQKGSFTYNVVQLFSRCFSLGDSLEVYAVKSTG